MCDKKKHFALQSSMSSLHNEISSKLKILVKASALCAKKFKDAQADSTDKENKDYDNIKKKIEATCDTCNFTVASSQSARAEIKLVKVHKLEDKLENM